MITPALIKTQGHILFPMTLFTVYEIVMFTNHVFNAVSGGREL